MMPQPRKWILLCDIRYTLNTLSLSMCHIYSLLLPDDFTTSLLKPRRHRGSGAAPAAAQAAQVERAAEHPRLARELRAAFQWLHRP